MPYYTFIDGKTGEEITTEMKISERDAFLKDNPHMTQAIRPVSVVDPVGIGVTKPPSDFSKYVLGKIQAQNPHGKALEKRWSITKEV